MKGILLIVTLAMVTAVAMKVRKIAFGSGSVIDATATPEQ